MITAVPSWLYKYTTVEWALQTLRDGEVYFPARRQLNDPFDCRVTLDFSTTDNRRRIVEKVNQRLDEWRKSGLDVRALGVPEAAEREEIHRRLIADDDFAADVLHRFQNAYDISNVGVCCLTETNHSLPMWAHYASNHAGCCLEFDFERHLLREVHYGKVCFPFTLLKMVRYSSEYPLGTLEPNRSPLDTESAFLTKSTEWRDEREWRAIMPDTQMVTPFSKKSMNDLARDYPSLTKRMKGAGLYKLDEGIIRGVILGCKMKEVDKAAVIAAARECGARVYQAKPKTFEFGLDITLVQDKPGNRA